MELIGVWYEAAQPSATAAAAPSLSLALHRPSNGLYLGLWSFLGLSWVVLG